MKQHAGSYDFGTFSRNDAELDRLTRQAELARDIERGILQQAGLRNGMRVLDLACGPGVITRIIADLVPDSEVYGVDLSEPLLETARQSLCGHEHAHLVFQQGNVYELDPGLGYFDFVYARFLFQHLERPMAALREIQRVLAPGGILLVADVDDQWLTLYPEPYSFKRFTDEAARGQSLAGGDRRIGRKLLHYMSKAGYTDVDLRIETITSCMVGMRNFLDVTTGFKKEQMNHRGRVEVAKELEEIYQLVDDPEAFGSVGVFLARGKQA
ncbi:methyltransferase domain-containing protein [Acanthopleuribacter pedis]|uniref:Methyltransferase domain-containing protein n=1 Tax=Acanthopleuribacter pedis TaxID=442870 RepID=A0A8J7Q6U6_9BACT|nr:methyltransferase domain-containing protein [Acanthopleuribacter pedis]